MGVLAAYWHAKAYVLGYSVRLALRAFYPHVKLGKRFKCYHLPKITHLDGDLRIGARCSIGKITLFVTAGAELTIDDNVSINDGVVIGARGHIHIGRDTMIAEYVTIRDSDHGLYDIARKERGADEIGKVEIGEKVWIGRGVCILNGSTIGEGATVGANAVVKGLIEAGSVAVGVPARSVQVQKNKEPQVSGVKSCNSS